MESILSVKNLSYTYPGNNQPAVEEVNFDLEEGQILGLVGASGSGKSTILNLLAQLIPVGQGELSLKGRDIKAYGKDFYKEVQLIFQNPKASLNNHHKVSYILDEIQDHLGEAKKDNAYLLEQVGLDASYLDKYPSQLSGGECQRVAIARAFSVDPAVLLCDEVTSALDPITAIKIMNLLKDLTSRQEKSVIFVSHNLPIVSSFCDQVLVLDQGKIVEAGETEKVFKYPESDVTKKLLSRVLTV